MVLTMPEKAFISVNGLALLWSVISNACVIIVVFKNSKMRSSTNLLICNLAVSDFLFGGVVIPHNLHDISHTADYFKGAASCRIVNFLPITLIICSVYTLVVMSFDRYRAIVKNTQMSWKQVATIIPFLWFFSVLCSIPSVIEYSLYAINVTETVPYPNATDVENMPISNFNISQNITSSSQSPFQTIVHKGLHCGSHDRSNTYALVNGNCLLIVGYILPTIFLWINYGRVIHYIVQASNRVIGSNDDGKRKGYQLVIFKRKVKVVKMLVIVAALFDICWLPYFTILIYLKSTKQDDSEYLNGWVNLMRIVFSTFSVSYNAILYLTYTEQFCRGFAELFACPLALCSKKNTTTVYPMPQQG